MFTGLIRDIGEITQINRHGNDMTVRIRCALEMSKIDPGASICCSGCCLTVTQKGEDWFNVDISAESLSRTSLGQKREGDHINLEPSLKLGDELGGHFVFGHVDGLAKLVEIKPDGESRRCVFEINDEYNKYIAPKGSVALDGISLTINEVEKTSFGVNIIPHTWDNTTLKYNKPGDALNFEIDMLARYVAKQLND